MKIPVIQKFANRGLGKLRKFDSGAVNYAGEIMLS